MDKHGVSEREGPAALQRRAPARSSPTASSASSAPDLPARRPERPQDRVARPKRPFSAPIAGTKTPESPATRKSGRNRDRETGQLDAGVSAWDRDRHEVSPLGHRWMDEATKREFEKAVQQVLTAYRRYDGPGPELETAVKLFGI